MINKEIIQQYTDKGYSFRKISRELNVSLDTITYWANKYNIKSNYQKLPPLKIDKIETREQAYMIGFLLGDGHIDEKGNVICSVSIRDREILELIADQLGARILDDKRINKKKRQFPHSTLSRKVGGIEKIFGGRLKDERRFPRIRKDLERYLLQGFFDADGSVSFGKRKDRDRLWHKISFTSSFRLLEGVQNMLMNNLSISSKIKPKSNENCFVLEFANKKDVNSFIDYIYPVNENNFVVLKRKYNKINALRLELEEFGER